MPYFSRNTVVVDSPLFSNISYSFGKVFPNIVGFHGDTVFACARALFFSVFSCKKQIGTSVETLILNLTSERKVLHVGDASIIIGGKFLWWHGSHVEWMAHSSGQYNQWIYITLRTDSPPFVFCGKHSPNLSPLCLQYTALPVRLYNCRQCRRREVGRVLPPEDEGGGCPF